MYKLINFLILNNKFSTGKIFIRNKELPICSKCLHFIEHTNNYPYDPVPSNDKYGRCNKFGEMDMVTGTINYDLASNCRLNDSKCGKFGSEYNERTES
jgi:hypothetical protein